MAAPGAGGIQLGQSDNSLLHLGGMLGERTPQRKTLGSPGRTHYLATIQGLLARLEALERAPTNLRKGPDGQMQKVRRYVPEGLRELPEQLCHLWASEGGYDNDFLVKAVGAAKGQVTYSVQRQEPAEGT